jgi:lipopolysaccharide/colanic/teichoic acid biosynthesis glycosyltransferase
MIKLRSMRQSVAGERGSQVTARGDTRITAVGRVIRKLKLDELPELWNVVRGEMALVGPRPEVPAHVELEDPRWQAVLAARPGLTDPVTLTLRNEEELLAGLSADEREIFYRTRLIPYKLAGYQEYLERRTPWQDLKVLWATALGVLLPRRHPPPEL